MNAHFLLGHSFNNNAHQ